MTDPFAPPQDAPLYGAPLYGEPLVTRGPARNGLGTAALVLGVLGLLGCLAVLPGVLLGVPAVVLGALGRRRARRRQASNGGVALAGLLVGATGALVSIGLVVWFLTSPAGRDFLRCASDATTAQERDACTRTLDEQLFAR